MAKNTQRVSVRVIVDGNTTAEDLKKLLTRVPDKARPDLSVSKGDRPYESDQKSITFTWEEEL